MQVTFGATTPQYDGRADDADPNTNPPPAASYSGPNPDACQDGPSSSSSSPFCRALAKFHLLLAEARALTGPGSTNKAKASSFNKLPEKFEVTYNIFDYVMSLIGIRPVFSMELGLIVFVTNSTGSGNVRAIAWLMGAAGLLAQIQHSYDFNVNPNDATLIDVKRDGVLHQTIPNGGYFADKWTSATVGLRPGNYTFQSELNIMDEADGKVEVSALTFTMLSY